MNDLLFIRNIELLALIVLVLMMLAPGAEDYNMLLHVR